MYTTFSTTTRPFLTGLLFLLTFSASLWQGLQAQACSQPSNLNAANLTTTSVRLSWSAIQGAVGYTVQYRLNTAAVWTTVNVGNTTTRTLTGLAASTVYSWRVKASCSTYSSVAVFNTGGSGNNTSCSQPSNLNAVNLSPTSVRLSWSAIQGAFNYTVQYRLSTTAAWTTVGPVSGTTTTLTGLAASTVYNWRVKASCSTYSSVASFNTGGSGNNTSCSQPSNLNAVNLSPTSVRLSWSAIQGAFNYTVQYRLSTTAAWTTQPATTGLTLTLSALQSGVQYQWRVKASCSTYSSVAVFTTLSNGTGTGGGGSTSCSAPSNTNTVSVFSSSAVVEWEANPGAANYTVQYRRELGGSYITVGTFTAATATIAGLQAGTEYVWRVKANCSPYGSDVQFATPFALVAAPQTDAAPAAAMVYPNPVRNGMATLVAPAAEGTATVMDVSGRVLHTQVVLDVQTQLDLSALQNGIYFVRIQSGPDAAQTIRIVVAH